MDQLPDVILLEVFSKLYFVDLCICSQVCRQWYILAQSSSLRKRITITRQLKDWQLHLLIKNHFHERLEAFELQTDWKYPLLHVKKHTFFNLRDRCPNLKKLILMGCSLSCVTLEDMPSTLQHLSIRGSEINPYQFFKAHPQLYIPHLTCLDVGGVSNFFTSENLHIFSNLKSLRCLYLEGCFRINNAGIESLIDILPQLQVMDVEGTDISNEGVQTIITHAADLKELYIGHTCIDDEALSYVAIGKLPKLSTICIKSTKITLHPEQKFSNKTGMEINILKHVTSSDDTILTENNFNHINGCNHYLDHLCCC